MLTSYTIVERGEAQTMYDSMGTNYTAYVRVLHAVPDAPNVDVYANGVLLAGNVAFGNMTAYMPVEIGIYKITIYPAGSMTTPVLKQMIAVTGNDKLTVAAVGTLSDISAMVIRASNQPMQKNKVLARFIHLSPNAPAVDITLPDGTVIFNNISYLQVSDYISLPPDTYTLQVRVANTPTIVLTVPNVLLEANKYYTVYAIGFVGKAPSLQALPVQDF